MRRIAILVALIPLTPSAGGAADTFFERFIAERDGVAPCYALQRGGAFLGAHPSARVERFFLGRSPIDDLAPPHTFEVLFRFGLRGSTDSFSNEAGCVETGTGATCGVEGDGGEFSLAGDGDGLRLTIEERVQVEGRASFSHNLAERDEDRVLLLQPAPAEDCSVE
jgi:hypothetical protein